MTSRLSPSSSHQVKGWPIYRASPMEWPEKPLNPFWSVAFALKSAFTCLRERFREDDLVANGLLQRLKDKPALEPRDGRGL